MLAKPVLKSHSSWKWIAIVSICLFLISTAIAAVFAVESVSQSREIMDLNETIESYERALGISPDPLLDEVDPDLEFPEIQGEEAAQ